jgi:hypothetical protein
MRNSRWRDRRFAANVNAGVAAAMTELNRRPCAARMDRCGEPRQAGQESVIINGEAISTVTSPMPPRTRAM